MRVSLMNGMVKIAKIIGVLVAAAALLFGGFLLFLTAAEYRPSAEEPAEIAGGTGSAAGIDPTQPIDIISWNIGYCGLGAKQDFFMDGGALVRPENKQSVEENLAGIIRTLQRNPADMYFIQELDKSSKRSYYIDQHAALTDALAAFSAYTYNFKAAFVPYPFPPIGKVASGVGLFTRFPFARAYRFALPVPFTWPVSTVNLKRCMLITRFPLASGKELVAVNVHLEAYDEGEGKVAQTKALTDFVRAEYAAGNYVIVGGDFNQTFPGFDLSRYPVHEGRWAAPVIDGALLTDGWRFAVDERTPSCRLNNAPYEPAITDEKLRKDWQYYVIDGFIVSPNVSVQSVETLDESFRYADHNPVKLRVLLKGAAG